MTDAAPYAQRHPVPALLACVLLVAAIASLGALFPPGDWYAGLAKPSFNPPNWVFGPAWTTLYLMIAVATWLLWRAAPGAPRSRALRLNAAQLLLNAAWSPLFFGMRNPLAALVDLVSLFGTATAYAAVAGKLDRPAAFMMVPYIGWLGFAGYLNEEIWRLNRR